MVDDPNNILQRGEYLVGIAQNSFNRQCDRSIALTNRCGILLGLDLAVLSLVPAFFLSISGGDSNFIGLLHLIGIIASVSVSLMFTLACFSPQNHPEYAIVENGRFKRLLSTPLHQLHGDYLSWFEFAYADAENIYKERLWAFKWGLRTFLIGSAFIISFSVFAMASIFGSISATIVILIIFIIATLLKKREKKKR